MKGYQKNLIYLLIGSVVVGCIFGYLEYTNTNGIFIGRLDSYQNFENNGILVNVSHFNGSINHSEFFDECRIVNEDLNRYIGKNIVIFYSINSDNYTIAKYIELDTNEY